MQAGIVAADVAQGPGDVGIACLPVGVAVELSHLADLLVEQHGDGGVERGVVGDDFLGGFLADIGGTVDRLVDGVAKRCEFRVQRIDRAAHARAVVERREILADRIHLVAGAVGLLAVLFVELSPRFRIHHRWPVQDVGGKAAFGIHVARNFAHGPDHLQPALGNGDPVHRLIFRNGHIDGEAAADSGQGDNGGSQQGTDFHWDLGRSRGGGETGCGTVVSAH